jgi:hypothetical protein
MFEVLGWTPILIGVLVATVAALFTIRWLMHYLSSHGLVAFGWYRLGLTAVLVGLIAGGVVSIEPADAAQSEALTTRPLAPIAKTLG